MVARRLGGLIAVVVLLTASGPSWAQSNKERAQKHFELAEAYEKTGAHDKAIREYKAAYEAVPAAGFLFNIGLVYEIKGDDEKAVEYYGRYLDKAPDGRASIEAKARKEALEEKLAKARKLASEKATADAEQRKRAAEAEQHRVAGDEHAQAGRYVEAVEAYRASYEGSKAVDRLFDIGEAYRRNGDLVEAVVVYEQYRIDAPGGANSAAALRYITELRSKIQSQRSALGGLEQSAVEAAERGDCEDAMAAAGEVRAIDAEVYSRLKARAPAIEVCRSRLAGRAEVLRGKLSAAAAVGECSRVRELVKQVGALDPELSASAFAGDPSIADCLVTKGKTDKGKKKRSLSPVKTGYEGWGFRAGYNVFMPSKNPLQARSNDGQVFGVGWDVGGYISYRASRLIVVQPELLYNARSAGFDRDDGPSSSEVSRQGLELHVPVRFEVVAKPSFSFYLTAGAFAGVVFRSDFESQPPEQDPGEFGELEAGAIVGFSFRIKVITFEVRYIRSVVNLADQLETSLVGISFLGGFQVSR